MGALFMVILMESKASNQCKPSSCANQSNCLTVWLVRSA